MKLETFFEKFDQIADAPDAVKKIRELVLDLAVQGKLVEQDPNDEPASSLIEQITTEKSALVKRKVIRASNNHTKRNVDCLDGNLPQGWAWVLVDEITSIGTGSTPLKSERAFYANGDVPWVTSASTNNQFIEAPYQFVTQKAVEECNLRIYPKGSLLIALYGQGKTRGQVGQLMFDSTTNQACAVLEFFGSSEKVRDYIRLFFLKKYDELREQAAGGAQPNLSGGMIRLTRVPLPPLAEQRRIVAKVDELMVLCDRLEAQQQERETRHAALARASLARFADLPNPANLQFLFHPSYTIPTADLRKSILNLAVQGKLVPQDPNDEPASRLIERIKSEKSALVKEKVIRASNAHTIRDVDRIGGDLPYGWMWVLVDEITSIGTGSTPLKSERDFYVNGDVPWVTSAATNNQFIEAPDQFVTQKAVRECNLRIYPKGSLLIALYGQGKTRGQVGQLMFDSTTNQACAVLEFFGSGELVRDYIRLFFLKKYDELREQAAGGAQPNLSGGMIRLTRVPLPPIDEQRRIVAKVVQLMALVDALETQLAASRVTAANLLSALVAELTTKKVGGDET